MRIISSPARSALSASSSGARAETCSLAHRWAASVIALGPIRCGISASGSVRSRCAAALLSPEKGAELASRASPAYVADIARNADLRHISELLDGIPHDTIVNAATELARSGDHVVLGGFASAIADGALEAVLESIDSSALLETGFYLEDL